jgi:hypothetical protein
VAQQQTDELQSQSAPVLDAVALLQRRIVVTASAAAAAATAVVVVVVVISVCGSDDMEDRILAAARPLIDGGCHTVAAESPLDFSKSVHVAVADAAAGKCSGAERIVGHPVVVGGLRVEQESYQVDTAHRLDAFNCPVQYRLLMYNVLEQQQTLIGRDCICRRNDSARTCPVPQGPAGFDIGLQIRCAYHN